MRHLLIHGISPSGGSPGQAATISSDGASVTWGPGGLTAEEIRDLVAALLVPGANVTITADDPGDAITIAANLDAEGVRDILGATLVGVGLEIIVDDAANTVTLSASRPLTALTTVIGGEPALVWDNDNNLIHTEGG